MSMREHKIVVLGPMGAGKSTLVRAIGNGRHVDTDVANTDASSSKLATTVAMDYADVDLPNGDRLRVFGTPGQERFDFIWPILLEGACAAIVLLDASLETPDQAIGPYLQILAAHAPLLPVVVGVTRCEGVHASRLDACAAAARLQGRLLPVIPLDARQREDVMLLMDVLMAELDALALLAEAG